MKPIVYPLSAQDEFVSNLVRLAEVSPESAERFRALRQPAIQHSTLTPREQELCLLAGFAAGRNEGAFRVHCRRASEQGVTLTELEQLVLLMLGTSLGLAPVVETLSWLHEELL